MDVLLITGSHNRLINAAKEALHRQFKVKDLGELKCFLGTDVLRSKSGILLNKKKYMLRVDFRDGVQWRKSFTNTFGNYTCSIRALSKLH